jgi:glycerol uptake facilitator-like aquaporin
MVATTSDTTFCDSTIQVYIFIPTILMLAREYSYRSQGLNPAFAFAFEFFYCAYNGQWFLFQYVWATFFGPFIGAALAVTFFEGFYRKFIIVYKKRQ